MRDSKTEAISAEEEARKNKKAQTSTFGGEEDVVRKVKFPAWSINSLQGEIAY